MEDLFTKWNLLHCNNTCWLLAFQAMTADEVIIHRQKLCHQGTIWNTSFGNLWRVQGLFVLLVYCGARLSLCLFLPLPWLGTLWLNNHFFVIQVSYFTWLTRVVMRFIQTNQFFSLNIVNHRADVLSGSVLTDPWFFRLSMATGFLAKTSASFYLALPKSAPFFLNSMKTRFCCFHIASSDPNYEIPLGWLQPSPSIIHEDFLRS